MSPDFYYYFYFFGFHITVVCIFQFLSRRVLSLSLFLISSLIIPLDISNNFLYFDQTKLLLAISVIEYGIDSSIVRLILTWELRGECGAGSSSGREA